jgi:WD40 repeat protein
MEFPKKSQPTTSQPATREPPADDSLALRGLTLEQSFKGAPDMYGIAWSSDGRAIATGGREGKVTVWSTAAGGDSTPLSL